MTEARHAETVIDAQRGFGSLGSIIYLLVLTWAAAIAAFPLNDNSFFTHLATGRIILDQGSVPSTDPYTFAASGAPWTVQSWLASVSYAGAERLAGDLGLRVLVLVVVTAAVSALWALTRPAKSLVVRFLLVAIALLVATGLWSERPYMVGVVGLGLVLLALDDLFPAWLLVPFMWAWVNAHGSFPMAIVLIGCWVVGAMLDRRGAGLPVVLTRTERKVSAAVVAGTLLGAIGPVGPALLSFPLKAVSRGDVFVEIVEWQPPTYRSVSERGFLVLVVITVLMLVRAKSWRLAIPATLFAAAGIYAQRNIVMAVVVLLAMAARSAPAVGTLTSEDRPPLGRPVAGLVALLAMLVGLTTVSTPAVSASALGGYPSHALSFMERDGLQSARVVAPASVGNLFEVLDGPRGAVFIDDRVDMVPSAVFRDYLRLERGELGWESVLDDHDVSVVLWGRKEPLSALLAADPDWIIRYSDQDWVLSCRRAPRGCSSP